MLLLLCTMQVLVRGEKDREPDEPDCTKCRRVTDERGYEVVETEVAEKLLEKE